MYNACPNVAIHAVLNFIYRFCKIVIFPSQGLNEHRKSCFQFFAHSRLWKSKMANTSKKNTIFTHIDITNTYLLFIMWALVNFNSYNASKYWANNVAMVFQVFILNFIIIICSWVSKNAALKHPKFATTFKSFFYSWLSIPQWFGFGLV